MFKLTVSLVCISISIWMLGNVYFDITTNINNYAIVYSATEQVVELTKISFINLIIIILGLVLLKRR